MTSPVHPQYSRRSLLAHLIAGASVSSTSGQSVAPKRAASPKELAGRFDAVVPELLRTTGVPGLAVSLVYDGQVVWTKGFGVRSVESRLPVENDTVFEAASLSKPVFAYVAMQLVERGKLELDSPLSQYLPVPWVPNEPRLKLITARMVLSHTSGLPHGRPPSSPIALRFDPGTRFAYSANGIEYLRAVVEELSGQPLPQLMKEGLLLPLKMESSSFGWQERFRNNFAVGHSRSARIGLSGNGEFLEATDEEKARISKDYPEYRYPSAAAGLYTTAGDYGRFLCAMIGSHAPAPLSPRMVEEMVRTQTRINESITWGLGWGLESTNADIAFWHWGDWGVFRSFAIGYKSTRTGVVVLTNSFNGPAAYKRIIYEALGGDHPAFSWVERYRP